MFGGLSAPFFFRLRSREVESEFQVMLKGRDTAIGYLKPEINSGIKVQTAEDIWHLIKSGAVLGRKP